MKNENAGTERKKKKNGDVKKIREEPEEDQEEAKEMKEAEATRIL